MIKTGGKKSYRTMLLSEDVKVAPIDVDDLQQDDSVTIGAGDTILWFSGFARPFNITAMKKTSPVGKDKPFKHAFSSGSFVDHLSSGPADRGAAGETWSYKYTVLFEDGSEIDPTVVIEQ